MIKLAMLASGSTDCIVVCNNIPHRPLKHRNAATSLLLQNAGIEDRLK